MFADAWTLCMCNLHLDVNVEITFAFANARRYVASLQPLPGRKCGDNYICACRYQKIVSNFFAALIQVIYQIKSYVNSLLQSSYIGTIHVLWHAAGYKNYWRNR